MFYDAELDVPGVRIGQQTEVYIAQVRFGARLTGVAVSGIRILDAGQPSGILNPSKFTNLGLLSKQNELRTMQVVRTHRRVFNPAGVTRIDEPSQAAPGIRARIRPAVPCGLDRWY
jgi:hypothetical protein